MCVVQVKSNMRLAPPSPQRHGCFKEENCIFFSLFLFVLLALYFRFSMCVVQVKSNMRLAPLVRNDTEAARRRIDGLESPAGPSGLYLEILK